MTPEIEKIINDYINSPTGTIKQIYPVIDNIVLTYNATPDNREWLKVNVFVNTYIEKATDLYDIHNFDWAWMMDYHILRNIFKLFGIDKLPYELNVYAPKNINHEGEFPWEYITGTDGIFF